MTERERVLHILQKKQPDQLPWCADLTYWRFGLETDGVYPAQYRDTWYDNGFQQLHRDLGIGFYLQGYEPFSAQHPHFEESWERQGGRSIHRVRSKGRELTEVSEYSAKSYSWGVVKHLVENAEELKFFCEMLADTVYTPSYELAEKRYETAGTNGVVLCYTPKSPLMQLVALASGVENFTYMLMDEEETVLDCLKQMERKFDEACELVVKSPAECIMIPENITSECVKPFYELMEGYHKKWTDRIRAAGKYSFVHQDGTVRGLIGELSKRSGFDVIEAVTPKPVGDITLEEARELVLPETIIWGGMPGGYFREDSTSDEEFDAHLMGCIEIMTKSPNYVLGVADQVVPGSSERRLHRVRELVDLYGKY